MVVPILRVADVNASLVFYVQKLGFQLENVTWGEGGGAVFALLSRDGNQIAIATHDRASASGGVTVLLDMDDEKSLRATCEHLRSQGVSVREEQQAQAFWLVDPDGHALTFTLRTPRGRRHYAPEDRLL